MLEGHKRVAVVLPYFGQLPPTWPLTLASMEQNSAIDWHIFTDQEVESYAPNIQVSTTTLEATRERFSRSLELDVALDTPYKLCDFKPAYGELYFDELAQYDYWGYCDADVVFGDVESHVLAALAIADFKIFRRGHLSLFPNSEEGRTVFKVDVSGVDDYRAVFLDPKSRAFDEVGGMYQRYERLRLPVFEDEALFDIAADKYRLKATSGTSEERFYLLADGKMSAHGSDGAPIRSARYIHLQKRRYRALPDGWRDAPVVGFAPDSVVIAATTEQACEAIRAQERAWSSRVGWYTGYLARRRNGLLRRLRK